MDSFEMGNHVDEDAIVQRAKEEYKQENRGNMSIISRLSVQLNNLEMEFTKLKANYIALQNDLDNLQRKQIKIKSEMPVQQHPPDQDQEKDLCPPHAQCTNCPITDCPHWISSWQGGIQLRKGKDGQLHYYI